MNGSRYPDWMVSFAAQQLATNNVRTANVLMESGNQGVTKPSHEPGPAGFDNGGDDRQKAFQDSLADVSITPNPLDEEVNRIQQDNNLTMNDVQKNIRSREKILTGPPEDAVKNTFYPKAKVDANTRYSRSEMAMIARSASNDILDHLDRTLEHAEEFVQEQVPVGQRNSVFASIENNLKNHGIGARFTRNASSDAPASGYDNWTTNPVANHIKDDFRSVPGDKAQFAGGEPTSYNNGNRTPTSIEKRALQNPAAVTNQYSKKGPATAKNGKDKRYATVADLQRRIANLTNQYNQQNLTRRQIELEKQRVLAENQRRLRVLAMQELMEEGLYQPTGMPQQDGMMENAIDDGLDSGFNNLDNSEFAPEQESGAESGGEDLKSLIETLISELQDVKADLGGDSESDSESEDSDSDRDYDFGGNSESEDSDSDSEMTSEASSRPNRFIRAARRRQML